jgi:hypothetical protein
MNRSADSLVRALDVGRWTFRSFQPLGSEMLRLFELTKGFMTSATASTSIARDRARIALLFFIFNGLFWGP